MRILFLILIITISCDSNLKKHKQELEIDKNKEGSWIFLNKQDDTIPGINLKHAYSLINNNTVSTLAVLDQSINTEDSIISVFLWKNNNDIESNDIDDDHNGYIDDSFGWNFRGGVNNTHSSYIQNESIRIIKYFKTHPPRTEKEFALLDKVKKLHIEDLAEASKNKEYAYQMRNLLNRYRETVSPYLNGKKPIPENLEILSKSTSLDSTIIQSATILINFDKYGYSEEYITDLINESETMFSKTLNPDFNERLIQGDNLYDINDSIYGNSRINLSLDKHTHGTRVASVPALLFSMLPQDQSKLLKIMPIVISGGGTNTDKDIAVAIKYAVNNGSKVVNMSFGKSVSLHNKWILDAIDYAAKNDVLIITSAGNSSNDITQELIQNYPNDRIKNGKELYDNFLKIGASTKNVDNLKPKWSNYSKIDVDLFAPGDSLKTRFPKNIERWDSGSSLSSSLVAGIATIIRSTYPSLTASEVKQILMDSAVKYDTLVNLPTKEDPDRKVLFSSLSKSGGIVNAYNALFLAEKIVNQK